MTTKTKEAVIQMVLNAPAIPASEKAELLEWLAGDGDDEEVISFDAAAQKLGITQFKAYKLALEGELKCKKVFKVKTMVTMSSFREYIAKHGKGGAE